VRPRAQRTQGPVGRDVLLGALSIRPRLGEELNPGRRLFGIPTLRNVSDLAPLAQLLIFGAVLLALGCGPLDTGQRPPTPGTGHTGLVATTPQDSSTSGLASYPDDPLPAVPPGPISPRFLAEHWSALNGQIVELQGVVVFGLVGDDACPASSTRCAEPRIFLAETPDPGRDRNYDVMVLVRPSDVPVRTRPEDTQYQVGIRCRCAGWCSQAR
jgi:hypothetical protein